MDVLTLLDYLIRGLSLGSVYAIIALGYTMVYGIAKMLNFAHGDVIMVGAYVCFFAMTGLSPMFEAGSMAAAVVPALAGVVLSMAVCTVLGVVIDLVGGVAVGRHPVAAYKAGLDPSVLHHHRGHVVTDQGDVHPRLMQLPGGEPRPLEQGPGLVGEHPQGDRSRHRYQ